jgi:hypothetical protein
MQQSAQRIATRGISAACRALALCACLLAPAAARAEYQIEGDVTQLRLEVTQAPIEEVFSALSAIYGVKISATVLPDQPVTGVYSGSLQRVVGQLLERYDYVLAVSPEKIEISFLGVRGGQGALVQVAQTGRGLRPLANRPPR